MIKVVDIFAGPGGLGEGFSSLLDSRSNQRFSLAVSIEKDPIAHQTLRLRAFARRFGVGRLPAAYMEHLRGRQTWEQLASGHAREARHAEREALCLELGPHSAAEVRDRISQALGKSDDWVLIGGPPCQAYSIVGRSRNRGNEGYVPEADLRQTLYVEYLQILADHAPPVFVMENVKGLLSAQLRSAGMFERIRADLADPAKALRREGRTSGKHQPQYELRALVADDSLPTDDPRRFIVRAESHRIPQRRHRVIVIGVRSDLSYIKLPILTAGNKWTSAGEVLKKLPRVRSGLSKTADSDAAWLHAVRGAVKRDWLKGVDSDVRHRIESVVNDVVAPRDGRGGEVLESAGRLVLNHSTRGHIVEDLERYLFSSCFAHVRKVSPSLADFPEELLPAHANVLAGGEGAAFGDRFRTQLIGEPATTVTSHISKDGHYYIHFDATQCRSLTVREAARLQTFPDDYFFCGPRTSQYQQVGNAVPPQLALQIAECISAFF